MKDGPAKGGNAKERPVPADALAIYRRLLGYVWPHRSLFLLGILGMVMFALTDASFALFIKYFIRDTFVKPDPRAMWMVPGALLILFLMRGIGDYLATYFPGRVGRQVIKSIRSDLFAQYLHLPSAYYDQQSSGMMLSRLTFNTEQVAEATTNSVKTVITDSLTLVALIGWMIWLSWEFTAVVLIVAPVIGWVMRGINRRFRRHSASIQQSMGDVTRVAKEAIEGHRVIKVFTAEDSQQRNFEKVNEDNRRNNVRLINAKAASSPVVQMVAALALAAVLAAAIREVSDGEVPVEDFISYIGAMLMVMAPLRRLVNVSSQLQQGIAAGASLFEVMDCAREPGKGGLPLQRAAGLVEFRNAGFSYPGAAEPALQEIDLSVGMGQTLAIVGKSGGGKSTLVGLVPRLYDVTSGAVLLDGSMSANTTCVTCGGRLPTWART